MNGREKIQQWRQWPGWRRHAPAAGSAVVHGAVLVAVAGMMASALPEKPQPKRADPHTLAVELVLPAPVEPELAAGVTPPLPKPAPVPERKTPARPSTQGPVTPAPSAAPDDDSSVYFGPPSILLSPDVPPGLASVMGNDPCTAKYGPKAKACIGRELAKRTGPMDSLLPRSKAELEQQYAAFMPKCTLRVGCEGGEWISPAGTRATGRPPPGSPDDRGAGTPGAGGAASIGGLSDSVGRLGFNPDHRDTGFGD